MEKVKIRRYEVEITTKDAYTCGDIGTFHEALSKASASLIKYKNQANQLFRNTIIYTDTLKDSIRWIKVVLEENIENWSIHHDIKSISKHFTEKILWAKIDITWQEIKNNKQKFWTKDTIQQKLRPISEHELENLNLDIERDLLYYKVNKKN